MTLPRIDERRLLEQLVALRARVLGEATGLAEAWRPHIRLAGYRYSAFNAACYLALRRRDLRRLQRNLVILGLSSLGRCEGHVLASLDAVIAALTAMCHASARDLPERPSLRHFTRAHSILERHTRLLLPKPAGRRRVRIMVTVPAESASDYLWTLDLVKRGADCMRVNCAHDSPNEWLRMVRNVRRAKRETGRRCAVLMDLCGPRARVGEARLAEPERRARRGDKIWLGTEFQPPGKAVPFQGLCSLPQLVGQLATGATVWMNEGRIGAKVVAKTAAGLLLEVFHARPQGEKFRAAMGLNFPGSSLRVAPLTPKDQVDLDFICRHADAVGYSFVQDPADMDGLAVEINRRWALRGPLGPLGVIAKIETERAVRNLPELIVRGAGRGPFGVMIARGDLAVEIGYLRIAEIQEEILWICEAAHVPVVWATQVLESFAKKGLPSRAEITDAAMSERAECVMLNKGHFISETVSILAEMLARMQAHQWKKMATFRALRSWRHLWSRAERRRGSPGRGE
jgi:pyruvate kinase